MGFLFKRKSKKKSSLSKATFHNEDSQDEENINPQLKLLNSINSGDGTDGDGAYNNSPINISGDNNITVGQTDESDANLPESGNADTPSNIVTPAKNRLVPIEVVTPIEEDSASELDSHDPILGQKQKKGFLSKFRSNKKKNKKKKKIVEHEEHQLLQQQHHQIEDSNENGEDAVPEYVDSSNDDISLPSLITEPDDPGLPGSPKFIKTGVRKKKKGTDAASAAGSTEASTPGKSVPQNDPAVVTPPSSPEIAPTPEKPTPEMLRNNPLSITSSLDDDSTQGEHIEIATFARTITSHGDKTGGDTHTYRTGAGDTYTEMTGKDTYDERDSEEEDGDNIISAGLTGILRILQCGKDTTLSAGKCVRFADDLCGPGNCGQDNSVVNEIALLEDEEEKFAMSFLSELIHDGIKLIYHEMPTGDRPEIDWRQSTVKLFIRPGNCHESELKQPKLAWAVLPVVSRMKISGSYEDGSMGMWNFLPMLKIHSILAGDDTGDDDTARRDAASKGASTVAFSGFFSITANTGDVYVFEAPTSESRDYIVRGIQSVVSRLSYHMIAGNVAVCAELYSEDAGQLTGELPSLLTPNQALSRVTHEFLNEL